MGSNILQVILPKKRPNPKGTSLDPTYNPASPGTVLAKPTYRDHLDDIFDTRQTADSNALLQTLFKQDPDVSATVNAYLSVASACEPWWVVYGPDGQVDPQGHDEIFTIIQALFQKNDYSLGFQLKPNMTAFFNELRYMALLRGGLGTELVLDKTMLPSELRHVDMNTVRWYESTPGQMKPKQLPAGSSTEIDLDTPLFFVSFFKRDPTSIYSYSPFVSAINSIASRQQVINDLYRIMRKTGYPRQSIKVVEEVLRKNAPADVAANETLMANWLTARLSDIATSVTNLSVDQVYVHFDAVEPGMLNEKMPGMEMNIDSIISTLNAQNQAALKTMATIIGRGESGTNTASVESRVFSMHADALNQPIAQLMSDILTLCLRLNGSQSFVEFGFDKAELRPELELEPQKTMRQARYLTLLSLGIISDDTFHIEMFNHPKPSDAPELSGTNFNVAATGSQADQQDPAGDASKQGSSVDRQAKPKGSGMAKSSTVTKR